MASFNPVSRVSNVEMPSKSGSTAETADTVEWPDSTGTTEPPAGTRTAAESEPDSGPIEWGPVRHDRLGSIALGMSLVVAVGLLAVVAVVVVAAAGAARTAVTGGAVAGGELWVLGVLLLVGGPFSLVYLLIARDRSDGRTRENLRSALGDYSFSRESIRLPWVIAGAVPFVALWVWGPPLADVGVFYLFPLIWFLPMVAGSRGTSIRLDSAERVVERTNHTHDHSQTDDLTAVIRTRRIDLAWLTVFLLAYRGNAWYRSTPWLFVPSEKADAVESALDAVLAASDGPNRASVPERVTLAALGSFSLVVGLLMAVAGGEGAGGVALTLLTAPFSILFLALAARL